MIKNHCFVAASMLQLGPKNAILVIPCLIALTKASIVML